MHRFRSVLKGESGSSLVEYAIVFILMMTMMLANRRFQPRGLRLSLCF